MAETRDENDSIHVYHEVALSEAIMRLKMEEYRDDPDLVFEMEDGLSGKGAWAGDFLCFYLREIPLLIKGLQEFEQKVLDELRRMEVTSG